MAQQLGGGEWYRDAECGACGKNNVGHEVAEESWSLREER